MAANGISELGTKQLKQEAKLAIATAKRQGKTVATNGTITGNTDSTKNYYRVNNSLNMDCCQPSMLAMFLTTINTK